MKQFFAVLTLLLVAGAGARAVDLPKPITLAQDRVYPFNMVGQLLFNSGTVQYVGSGTIIHPSSVLTAGHNVYDPDSGWSTQTQFRRGAYGTYVISAQYATHLYVLGGYQAATNQYGLNDVRSFAYDTAGLGFAKTLAGGAYVPFAANTSLHTSYFHQFVVGYGAEGTHTGDYPLKVTPTVSYTTTLGGFYENPSLYFEGGMSGGPNITWVHQTATYYVSGVVVSGATDPYAGGIHILDPSVYAFINTYLK